MTDALTRVRTATSTIRSLAREAGVLRPSPWVTAPDGDSAAVYSAPSARIAAVGEYEAVTEHITGFDPATARAVADLVDQVLDLCTDATDPVQDILRAKAIAVADTYLRTPTAARRP